jgi:taurine--2-oxoglutarate transaminase
VNAGHQHPKIIAAIKEQADKLCYIGPGPANETRAELCRMLADITPGDLMKSFLSTGGGTANENAVKIAKAYTGRPKIISRWRSYHGATYGAMSITGDPEASQRAGRSWNRPHLGSFLLPVLLRQDLSGVQPFLCGPDP